MRKEKLLFYSRCLLFLCAATGTVIEIVKYGTGMLLYYTVLSNLLVTLFCAFLVYKMWTGSDTQERGFLRLKGAVTMSIMITCVIYHFMLAPLAEDFWRVENLLCHYITPLYFLLDTLIVDKPRQYKGYDPIIWTALPLLYMLFALGNGLFFKLPIPDAKDSPFPYFFLNVTKYGWGYVLHYSAYIFAGYLVAGFVFMAVKALRKPSKM